MILVVAEHRDGALTRGTREAVTAAHVLAASASVAGLVLGHETAVVEHDLAASGVGDIHVAAHPLLATYTADAYASALAQVVTTLAPSLVLLPHSYRTRDMVPRVAARLGSALVTDAVGLEGSAAAPTVVRSLVHGKLEARVRPTGSGTVFVTLQSGAFEAAQGRQSTASIRRCEVTLDPAAIRQQTEAPFREVGATVDLTQAARLVAVGRGIQAQSNLPVAEALAAALGAELAASRPVCDSGWMGLERQVGSSGQTVAPRLYVALGISGAVQHLVGMRGARTVVAINKDPQAPIFDVADYGIVGDLFEVVPAIVAALKAPDGGIA